MNSDKSTTQSLRDIELEVLEEGREWMRRRLEQRLQQEADRQGGVSPPQPSKGPSSTKDGAIHGASWQLATPFGTWLSVNLNGLFTGTTYHYRVVATNEAGVAFGGDAQFTTSGCRPPMITSAQNLTNGTFLLLIDGTQTCTHSVYASTNLSDRSLAGTAAPGGFGSIQFIDTNSLNYSARFYQIRAH